MKFLIYNDHTPLIGKIAKLTSFGVQLEKEYEKLLEIGNSHIAKRIHYYNHCGGRYETKLIFIDEPPFEYAGVKFYCLKEIGTGANGDWYWFSMNQLIICEN